MPIQDLFLLLFYLIVSVIRLLRPGGARSVVAESLLLKHQLLILNRPRQRAPDLRPVDRIVAGLCTGMIHPARLLRSATVNLSVLFRRSWGRLAGATYVDCTKTPCSIRHKI